MAGRMLDGRVALVTGGASGIGRNTARRLADAGAAVLIADRDLDGAEAVAKEFDDRGATARVDVTDDASVVDAVALAEERFGRLDVLSQRRPGRLPDARAGGRPRRVRPDLRRQRQGRVELRPAAVPAMPVAPAAGRSRSSGR